MGCSVYNTDLNIWISDDICNEVKVHLWDDDYMKLGKGGAERKGIEGNGWGN